MATITPVRAAFATAHGSSVRAAAVGVPPRKPACASAENPVDLVHLSRQSLGDRSLEMEILALFRSQSELYLDRLENATTIDERKMAAHTILGSARGLGAWRVASEAESLQDQCVRNCDVSALRKAVEEANVYISELLED